MFAQLGELSFATLATMQDVALLMLNNL